jgi:type IV pilus assembly protein PilA
MKNLKVSNKKGFSLVELLVVIAVIGVIAAIAIPAMSSIFGESEKARNMRNGQNIASVANAALAAGCTIGTTAGQVNLTDDAGLIASLEAGAVAPTGTPFAGKKFSIGTMDADAKTDVAPFITPDATNGLVQYIANP